MGFGDIKMTRFFKYFAVPLILAVILTVVALTSYNSAKAEIDTVRHNDQWDNTVCVYDLAGKMTDSEVLSLNSYIVELEEQCLADIVVITLDDPEYGYLEMVHSYADWFAEEYRLGYDYPGGSAIVFVDNWSRGGDGGIHSWVSTTGAVRDRLSDSEADSILDILDEIESDDADPYDQYYEIVGKLAKKATPLRPPYSMFAAFIIALIVAAIYIFINLRSKLGDVTVTSHTYVKGGNGKFNILTDTFRNKTVTKRKIESSSGGSGGGGSHGGAGHSR